MRRLPSTAARALSRRVLLGALLLAGCSTAKVTSSNQLDTAAALRPAVVYVTDFDIEASQITSEPGLIGARPLGILPSGPLTRLRQGDPPSKARHLVDLMADTLVSDLAKAGLAARRVPPGMALPSEGWVVRGAFLQVDEGNRLRRAVIGFGAGDTQLQVAAAVDALSAAPPAPLYTVDTSAKSHPLPGAIVKLNPYVVAARFVLAGRDLDNNVKDTAGEIAKRVVARVNATPTVAH
ncbi:MAG TPA: DUF4410 domain-containing protein [Stellaceae bacterium]|nr:DUF4410 domain-containing protein [Stellaceae bacterium]